MKIKQHRIKLMAPVSDDNINKLNEFLLEFDQNAKAEFAEDPHYLSVRYDLTNLQFQQILDKVHSLGMQIDRSLWCRMVYAKWGFTEENERDNLSVSPSPCCSNPQSILSKAKRMEN